MTGDSIWVFLRFDRISLGISFGSGGVGGLLIAYLCSIYECCRIKTLSCWWAFVVSTVGLINYASGVSLLGRLFGNILLIWLLFLWFRWTPSSIIVLHQVWISSGKNKVLLPYGGVGPASYLDMVFKGAANLVSMNTSRRFTQMCW